MSTPEVTILLPVYNAEEFIEEAIISILRQTYKNFTFLIINDGSTDKTGEIISKFKEKDSRIEYYQRTNKGLIDTLNEGISLCRTELIARMDADDVAFPNRIERQVSFMNTHPEVSVCGTGMVYYETGKINILPASNDHLKIITLFSPPVFHPTVMMRRNAILSIGGYKKTAYCAEDFDLWERMIHSGFLFSNIQLPLLKYRVHLQKNRTFYHTQMEDTVHKIHARQLDRLGMPTDHKSLGVHLICCAPCRETSRMIKIEKKWFEEIYVKNSIKKLFSEKILQEELGFRFKQFTPIYFHKNPLLWIYRELRHFLNFKIADKFPKQAHIIKYFTFEIKKILRKL